jgi:ubiquinone/menaquinone biosynthesis C-methylase UbiE
MNQADLVELIRDGVAGAGMRWADLGAGEGAFTIALAELLGPSARITAVDRDGRALRRLADRSGIETRTADFTRPLGFSGLNGVLMANSLHFVRDKAPVLELVRRMLVPEGRLVIVEYSTDRGNPWVPHPFSYTRWERMAAEAGFTGTRLLRTIPSSHFGSMYAALSLISLSPQGRGSG